MSHEHEHHGHRSHSGLNYNRAFTIGITLNILFIIVEVIYGIFGNSLALIADAGHNITDVLSLLLAWGAYIISSKKPSSRRTYGFRRVTILASLISSLLLLTALGGITWEAIGRLNDPMQVQGNIIIIVAGIGIIINFATALLFVSGKQHDLNIKGAYIHMLADAGVSLGVVIGGIAISASGLLWLDPVISIIIVIVIFIGSWGLFKESINLSIDAVPENIDISGIKNYLNSIENVSAMHDLHIWALSTTETALTAHLTVNKSTVNNINPFLNKIEKALHDHFNIEHVTIQIEEENVENACRLNQIECIKS
jgi:cobalt-zinc-cadmium efflux system protein